jgi:hypothetical protein
MKKDKTRESAAIKSDSAGKPSTETSRRQFAKTMAVIAASPLLPGFGAARGATRPINPDLSETMDGSMFLDAYVPLEGQAQDADKPTADAEALAEVVRIRYGKNLSDDQLGEVKRSVYQRVRGADRLKQFKLANGDEPAFIFSADPDTSA